VLLWLNILAVKKQSVAEILTAHWQAYGRNYYSRHDYEALPTEDAQALMQRVESALGSLPGQSFGDLEVEAADSFAYEDSVDGSVSRNQGLRILFKGGARAVFRLSGTGTEGATLRLYLEALETDPARLGGETQEMLAPVAAVAAEISGLEQLGRDGPDVIT
jgi:phosphoglucomutase